MPTTKAGERLLDWGEYDRLLMGREMTTLRNRIRAVERQSVAAERARIRAAVERIAASGGGFLDVLAIIDREDTDDR